MGFLRPVAMEKVGLLGLKDDREVLLSVLHDLGVVEVEPIGKEALQYLQPEHGPESQRAISDGLLRFRGLKSALPAQARGPPRQYPDLSELFAAARSIPIDEEVGGLKREEDRLLTEERGLDETTRLLDRFSFYDQPLEYLWGRNLLAFFGEADAEVVDHLKSEIPTTGEALFLASPAEDDVRFLIAVPTAHAETITRLAQQAGVRLTAAPRLSGTPAQMSPRLTGRRTEVERRLGEIRARLLEIAHQWYAEVAALEEAFAIENRKLELYGRMAGGRSTFAVEGWVPKRSRAALERSMTAATSGRALLYSIPTTETAPTLMDNPSGVRVFEFFIRFYALPQSNEWDPTWIFALVFPFFFGLMLGDIGYGLVILAISLWMIAGFPGGRRLPKILRRFPTLIMRPASMQRLAKTLVPGCVVAIAFGFAFNEFFGFQLPFLPWRRFDPLSPSGVALLLKLAGFTGLAMVSLGFGLGALKEYFHHHRAGVLGRVGGLLFAWGVTLFGLAFIQRAGNPSIHPLSGVYLGVLFTGIGFLIAGERGRGLMALPEIVSHVLSYTRLVGILLSSVILALVINGIAQGLIRSGNVGSLVGAVALLIVGQGFNVILGVFEPGIQGARLIFVEHFSKYYSGNGRPFRPFGSARNYTVPAPSATGIPGS